MKNLINKETKNLNVYRIGDSQKLFHTFDNGDVILCDSKYISVSTSYNSTLSKGYLRVGCQSIPIEKAKNILEILTSPNDKEVKIETAYFYKDKRMKGKPEDESPKFFIFRGNDRAYRAYDKRFVKIKEIPVSSDLITITINGNNVKYNPYNAYLVSKDILINNLTNLLELYKLIYETE